MNQAHEAENKPVSPSEIALTYDRVVSAHWRGETEGATTVGNWFESHWSDQAPPEPDDPPEGMSILGGAGSGIRWYTHDDVIIGIVSQRRDGYYRVRKSEALPSLIDSWDILEREATRQLDADHLLGPATGSSVVTHSMRDVRQSHAQRQSIQIAAPDERDVQVLVERDAAEQ